MCITGSIQVFVWARPPVVTFTLGLVAITMTIFLVAFYIRDKDLVLDSHAQEDWDSLIHHLTSQKLCINMSDLKNSSTETHTTEWQPSIATKPSNRTCFPVQVNHPDTNASLPKWPEPHKKGNAVRLAGHINLEGWNRSCLNRGSSHADSNLSVAVALVIPSTSIEYSDKAPSSPWLYFSDLPHLQQPLKNLSKHDLCHSLNVSSEVVGNFISYNISSADACKSENVIQLSSNISDFKPDIFLSMDNKLQIFAHLLQIGYIFLCIISILLLTIMIQARTKALSQQHTLLPTKEMP